MYAVYKTLHVRSQRVLEALVSSMPGVAFLIFLLRASLIFRPRDPWKFRHGFAKTGEQLVWQFRDCTERLQSKRRQQRIKD